MAKLGLREKRPCELEKNQEQRGRMEPSTHMSYRLDERLKARKPLTWV